MTTGLDTAMRKVAANVLTKFGTTVACRVVTLGSYDTSTGGATDTVADTTCRGVLRAISYRELFGAAEVTDQLLLVPASELASTPRPRDRVVIATYVYEIVEVRPIRVQDLFAAYDLVLRGPLP